MEGRFQRIFLTLSIIFYSGYGLTEEENTTDETLSDVFHADIERREFKTSELDTENFEVGIYGGMLAVEDFGSNALIGLNLAYHINESVFAEATYGITSVDESSFERLSGSVELLEDRDYQFYGLSMGWNILPGEVFISDKYAFNTSTYIIAGVGNTDFAGDSYFTYNFGGGFRFYATDYLALRLDVRDYIFDIDLLGKNGSTHNLAITTGISIYF